MFSLLVDSYTLIVVCWLEFIIVMTPSFSVSPFLDDYMIDIIKLFVLIDYLLCLESNAICMLFCRPFMLGLNRCIDATTIKEFYYVDLCSFGFVCWFLYPHFFWG